jgi:hypothetical protein
MRNFLKVGIILFLAVLTVMPVSAQKDADEQDFVYRRSSLYPILLETDPVFDTPEDADLNTIVMKAYGEAPFPDKYNDHRLADVSFKFNEYITLSADEAKEMANEDGKEKGRKKDQKYMAAAEKFLAEKDVARGMVAKWFNRSEKGGFDMSLIHERGAYNAGTLEVELASGSKRGMAMLKDAGEELIKNSFVVINRMRFVKNEPIARATRDIALIAASKIKQDMLRLAAETAAKVAYEATKDGYSVWTVSYLYQLEWNDEIANNFYMNMWMDDSSIDEERKKLFETTDIFKLNFVGFEKSKSLVLFSVGKSKEMILTQATVRNIDRTYVKLQKSFDVFKTKTPITGTGPLVAPIGMKDGVSKGTKFDVLEMIWDEKEGVTTYKVVGKVKAKEVWDNRFTLGEEDTKANEDGTVKGTVFKGKGEVGMLLRQKK